MVVMVRSDGGAFGVMSYGGAAQVQSQHTITERKPSECSEPPRDASPLP